MDKLSAPIRCESAARDSGSGVLDGVTDSTKGALELISGVTAREPGRRKEAKLASRCTCGGSGSGLADALERAISERVLGLMRIRSASAFKTAANLK